MIYSLLTLWIYAGLRAAIDPHQIPSPIEVIEGDREAWEGKTYPTLPGNLAPLSTTSYTAIDQGKNRLALGFSYLRAMSQETHPRSLFACLHGTYLALQNWPRHVKYR